MIPNVAGVACLVAGAIHPVVVAISVYRGTSEGGAYYDMTEYASKRFQQILAESFSRPDCQFRIVGDIGNAVRRRNLRIQKITHEEML